MREYSRIKGVSERRRLPRLGKIRLGIRQTAKSGREYPVDADHFICPPEVCKVYGETPRELDVLLPVDDARVTFPQSYKAYGSNRRLKCIGDGVEASRFDEGRGEWVERSCPCEWLEEGKCALRAHLMVVLPRVSLGGVYQIDTGSYNAIVDVNSYLDFVRGISSRENIPFSRIPLKLLRQEREIAFREKQKDGSVRRKVSKHHILQLRLDEAALDRLRKRRLAFEGIRQVEVAPPVLEGEEVPAEPEAPRKEEPVEEKALPQHEVPDDVAPELEAAVNTMVKAVREAGFRQNLQVRSFVRRVLRNNWNYDPESGVCDPLTEDQIRRVMEELDRKAAGREAG
jgi:hypothetical protein